MHFNYCPSCGKKDTVQKQDDTNYECSNCGWHFWNNAKTTVTPIFMRQGKLLAARRGIDPHKGKLDTPGGFVEYNEGVYEAAVRETLEETGLTIVDMQLVDVYHREYLPGISVCDVVFAVTKWRGTPKAADDIVSLEWQPLEAIDGQEFAWHYPGLVQKLKKIDAAR